MIFVNKMNVHKHLIWVNVIVNVYLSTNIIDFSWKSLKQRIKRYLQKIYVITDASV